MVRLPQAAAYGARTRWVAALFVFVLVLVGPGVRISRAGGADTQILEENQVKAAFLFNFAKFVEWPAAAGPLVIGVAGDEAFGAVIDRMVQGRTVGGRELVVRKLRDGDDPSGCQMLFVGASHKRLAADVLQRTRGPVLTVGETVQFMRDGGMVRFYVENNRVRFQINQRSAEAAGLKVSSQLLTLAAR